MKYKVSELEGALLDVAVALADGWELDPHRPASDRQFRRSVTHKTQEGEFLGVLHGGDYLCIAGWRENARDRAAFLPSTRWEHAGPIIEREQVHFEYATGSVQAESRRDDAPYVALWGPTMLVAAMRAYVASKFGDEVDLP